MNLVEQEYMLDPLELELLQRLADERDESDDESDDEESNEEDE